VLRFIFIFWEAEVGGAKDQKKGHAHARHARTQPDSYQFTFVTVLGLGLHIYIAPGTVHLI
jgi:hypothetical protein